MEAALSLSDPQVVLSDTPLFAGMLDAQEIHVLASQSRMAFFREGTLLMSQGDFGTSMFVLVEGLVDITFADRKGGTQTVAQLARGDIVGEMSLFTGDRRTASAGAVVNVTAVEITKTALERLFATSPELLDRFATLLARRQSELNAIKTRDSAEKAEFIHQARRFFNSLFGRTAAGS